jgi:hypothetical protein
MAMGAVSITNGDIMEKKYGKFVFKKEDLVSYDE